MRWRKDTYHVLYINDFKAQVLLFQKNKDILTIAAVQDLQPTDSFLNTTLLCCIDTKEVLNRETSDDNLNASFDEVFPAFSKSIIYYDFQSTVSNRLSILKKTDFESLQTTYNISTLEPDAIRLGTAPLALNNIGDDFLEIDRMEQVATNALAAYIKEIANEHNFEDVLVRFRESKTQKRLFEYLKWGSITFFILLLLVNFFMHEHYRSALEVARFNSADTLQLANKTTRLKNEILTKQLLLKSSNTLDINKLRTINNLLSTDLNEVTLSKIIYQPVTNTTNTSEPLKIQMDVLQIEGVGPSKEVTNASIAALEKNVNISDFKIREIKEVPTGILFKIQMQLNNDLK